MKVYRLCSEIEINKILKYKTLEKAGCYCRKNDITSHNYDETKKYLHFFKDKTSILYLDSIIGRFICVYDIPEDLLSKFSGVGIYKNFFNFSNLEEVKEYAIPIDLLKFEYLESVDEIITDLIEFEDFYEDENLSGLVERIYSKDLADLNTSTIS